MWNISGSPPEFESNPRYSLSPLPFNVTLEVLASALLAKQKWSYKIWKNNNDMIVFIENPKEPTDRMLE